MIRIAFNNLGFQHLEAAAAYRKGGPAGFLEAAAYAEKRGALLGIEAICFPE